MVEPNWDPVPVLDGQESLPGLDLPTQDKIISRLGVEGWEFGDVTLAIRAVCGTPLNLDAPVTEEQLDHIRHTLAVVWRAPNTKGRGQHDRR